MNGWRWLPLSGSRVFHLVQAWKPVSAPAVRWETACGGMGRDIILEPDGVESRCIQCLRKALAAQGAPKPEADDK